MDDRQRIYSYVSNPYKVSTHGFYPFIKRTISKRRFRKAVLNNGSKSKLRTAENKIREIYYANHIDSNIYSFYAEILSNCYEKSLKKYNLGQCVTAYRKVPLDCSDINSRNKCNVDFANDVFNYIRRQKPVDQVAITFDVKSFFDTLDHKVLKKRWREVLNCGANLPEDHYNVFRNITKFSFIYENQIFRFFKDRILVERIPDTVKTKPIARKKYLKNQRAIAYCYLDEVKTLRKSNLIKANKLEAINGKKRLKGIPQGSPISSVLANIYMLQFDVSAREFASKIGGIYRRYSDDMIVVCPVGEEEKVIEFMKKRICGEDSLLEIQEKKTQIFHFIFEPSLKIYKCFEKHGASGRLLSNSKFEYLGFQFDGEIVRLRNASLAGYYRKMKKSIKRALYYSSKMNNSTRGEVFRNRLYKRFTHLGAHRRIIYMRDTNNKSMFLKTTKYDWGNYLSYVYMAAQNISGNKIKEQVRNHWKIFHRTLFN